MARPILYLKSWNGEHKLTRSSRSVLASAGTCIETPGRITSADASRCFAPKRLSAGRSRGCARSRRPGPAKKEHIAGSSSLPMTRAARARDPSCERHLPGVSFRGFHSSRCPGAPSPRLRDERVDSQIVLQVLFSIQAIKPQTKTVQAKPDLMERHVYRDLP